MYFYTTIDDKFYKITFKHGVREVTYPSRVKLRCLDGESRDAFRYEKISRTVTMRTTECRVYDITDTNEDITRGFIVAQGESACHTADNFCKATGRLLSIQKAAKKLFPESELRQEFFILQYKQALECARYNSKIIAQESVHI